MPNRIIKESICTSDNLNELSLEEEIFFYRLLVQCDDYGLMDARPAILRAKCFPLRVDKIKEEHIEKWLSVFVDKNLIIMYEYDGRPYLKMCSWEEHQQIRSRRAKFPMPPDDVPGKREHILPEEKDIEDLLYDIFNTTKQFENYKLLSVERQVRVSESYLDIVLKTECLNTFIFELKRGRLSNKATDQLTKYIGLAQGSGILIGCGLSANFDISQCENKDIAVITYDDNMNFSLVLNNSMVNDLNKTLNHVKSRYARLAPNPIQSESNPNPIQMANDLFEKVWKKYPKKKGKGQISETQKKKLLKIGYEHLLRCIERYQQEMKGKDIQYMQHGSTFFNSGYIDYLDENYAESEPQEKSIYRYKE